MTDCPPSLQEQHTEDIKKLYELSFPCWIRDTMIVLFGVIFVLYGALWFYLITQYPTKEDVKEMRSEIRQDLREIKDKMDTRSKG